MCPHEPDSIHVDAINDGPFVEIAYKSYFQQFYVAPLKVAY